MTLFLYNIPSFPYTLVLVYHSSPNCSFIFHTSSLISDRVLIVDHHVNSLVVSDNYGVLSVIAMTLHVYQYSQCKGILCCAK